MVAHKDTPMQSTLPLWNVLQRHALRQQKLCKVLMCYYNKTGTDWKTTGTLTSYGDMMVVVVVLLQQQHQEDRHQGQSYFTKQLIVHQD